MSNLLPVLYKAESLLFERSRPGHLTVRFRIVHRFRATKSDCAAGEEVFAIFIVVGVQEIYVPFPLALRLIFDYLGRHRYVGQSAGQIAAGMRTAFYRNHAMNSGECQRRVISRSAVKEYIRRIRRVLAAVLEREGIVLNPSEIIASERGEGNGVFYRLRVAVEWNHQDDLPARSDLPLRNHNPRPVAI